MQMLIKQKFIFREDLQNNPKIYYLFGDNCHRVGLGGQAKEMRGEPNAIGIATKISPSNTDKSFFSDDWVTMNKKIILKDFIILWKLIHKTISLVNVVVPSDGLGLGLSDMENRCPRTLRFLNHCLAETKKILENQEQYDFNYLYDPECIYKYVEKYNAELSYITYNEGDNS